MVSAEAVHARKLLVEVPGDVSLKTENYIFNFTPFEIEEAGTREHTERERERGGNLRLDGVQPRHVHLEQPILPVHSGDPAVVDAARYVAKRFPILPKAVVLVVQAEGWRCPELQVNTELVRNKMFTEAALVSLDCVSCM